MSANTPKAILNCFVSWVKRRTGVTNAFWSAVPKKGGAVRYVVFVSYEIEGIPYQFTISIPSVAFLKKTADENTDYLMTSYESVTEEIKDYHKTYVELKEALNEINREHGYSDRVGDEEKTEEDSQEEKDR